MSARGMRHRAREAALQVLYSLDVGRTRDRTPDEAFDAVAAHFELPRGARDFARQLALSVAASREELDELIRAHALRWRLERMAAVDRNILRLAAFELMKTDTPTGVVLDEAVELARRFGDDPSPAFVNGILDALARSLRGGEA